MTETTPLRNRLDALGDALQVAAAADLTRAERGRRRRTVGAVLAVAAVVLPGAAVATSALITDDQVADSIPSGTFALIGTEPRCTTVRPNVEYDCRLTTPPRSDEGPVGDLKRADKPTLRGSKPLPMPTVHPAQDWKGAAEPTVGEAKHVNGGCRSLNAEGTHWRCYIGLEAVRQRIISRGFLGDHAPVPSRG
jgi:hypothetical protein